METASFNGLLKAILYILAFYYIFKFLARLFLPLLAKKVVEKASQQFEQQQQNYQQQNQPPSQQSTTNRPKEKKKVGEYVDFEEIE